MTDGTSLAGLAEGVAVGELSAADLVALVYERVGLHNARINAVVALRSEEEALAEARALDERARRGEPLGPLAGVPFLVKDSQDLSGLPTRHGSLLLEDAPPAERDAQSVARLRAAGAVPVGKTNVPEFCFEGFTANRLFGETLNPWAPRWSPGGSSGGSAAAMAAGMVPFATATDGGGSVRIPASFCGLYGLKPTTGLIAREAAPDWLDYTTDGPLALCMADLRLLLQAQAGHAPGDPASLPTQLVRRVLWAGGEPTPSVVLAAPRFTDWGPLPNAVADLFDAALTSLEKDLGLRVEPLAPAQIFGGLNVDEDWWLTAACEQAREFGADALAAEESRVHPAFFKAMEYGLSVTLDDYLGARRRRFGFIRALDELLGADRVLVTPTMPVTGFTADGRETGATEAGTRWSSYNTQAQNVTGHPALTVPAGVAPNGVPFGLQITGPRYGDALIIALGEAWEEAHPATAVAPGFDAFPGA